jgi:hypothetical protein
VLYILLSGTRLFIVVFEILRPFCLCNGNGMKRKRNAKWTGKTLFEERR